MVYRTEHGICEGVPLVRTVIVEGPLEVTQHLLATTVVIAEVRECLHLLVALIGVAAIRIEFPVDTSDEVGDERLDDESRLLACFVWLCTVPDLGLLRCTFAPEIFRLNALIVSPATLATLMSSENPNAS